MLDLPYERLGAVKRLVHPPAVEIVAPPATASGCASTLTVQVDLRGELENALADLGLSARAVLGYTTPAPVAESKSDLPEKGEHVDE